MSSREKGPAQGRRGTGAAGPRQAASAPQAPRRPGAARRFRAQAVAAQGRELRRESDARHRRHIGFRIACFALVLMFAFALVFPTLRLYLAQRQELRALRAQVSTAQASTDDLDAKLARWKDPAYIEAQARSRLTYVMPGDEAYRVVDPGAAPEPSPTASTVPAWTTLAGTSAGAAAGGKDAATLPWYTSLWRTVVKAGGEADATPTATPTATPAATASATATPAAPTASATAH